MTLHRSAGTLALVALVLLSAACRKAAGPDAHDALLAGFRNPPAEYRPTPLWVWNDRVTREEISTQLADFKARGIGGVFIHPRPGLITPYLSGEWLDLCKFSVETGKSLGLKVWIYDENSYPSGFAGGHVPARMPDAVRSGLRMVKGEEGKAIPGDFAKDAPLVILRATGADSEDVTARAAELAAAKEPGRYIYFSRVFQSPSPWYGGFTYVDVLRKDVTEMFLEITMNAYQAAIGGEFGRTVPGSFQDEAEIAPPGGDLVNYTPALFTAFEAKWGYDLRPRLPSLFEDAGDWRRVRHDFYSLLLDLFIENWAKPYYAWCTDNNLAFTGHYWEHEWPTPRIVPDSLAMAAYAHVPGIDILMNDFQRDSHAQFGNARAVREIRSAANQFGRRRTLSETFGAGGWDMTFFDQKRIADWELALGVNLINPHLSYVTIMGARKRDHPLSFSYHEPWWPGWTMLGDYFGRLSYAMSQGDQLNRALVLEPTTSAWMHYAPGAARDQLNALGAAFQDFVHRLEAEHLGYDLASEKTLEEFGRAGKGALRVGERAYDLVVLPPGLESLDAPTVALLSDFVSNGGRLISWAGVPPLVDARASEDVKRVAEAAGPRWIAAEGDGGFARWREIVPPDAVFQGLEPGALVFHQLREFEGGRFLFLANTDPVKTASGTVRLKGGSVESWDAFTGESAPYPFRKDRGGLAAAFEIPPGGSLLLTVRDRKEPPAVPAEFAEAEIPPAGHLGISRQAPNVLTLDYCDLVLDGKTERDLYFYEAQLKTFKRYGLAANPWDSAVQYKTNLLDLDRFSPRSGFEAVFGLEAEPGEYLAGVQAVVERPGLFKVAVNGRAVAPLEGAWWLDKAFGVFPIGPLLKAGLNRITLTARPFTIHSELEPVYIRGDFAVRPLAKGFGIGPAAGLAPGAWSDQGMPFYAEGVAYARTFHLPALAAGERVRVRLDGAHGAASRVLVNGKEAGWIGFAPSEIDVTGLLVPGANEVTAVVIGTLKNTLGPHHNDPLLGRAWPGQFQKGAAGGRPGGSAYHVVPYGLFGDVRLIRRTPK